MKSILLENQDQVQLEITIGQVRKVRDQLGVDLSKPESGDPALAFRMLDDDLFFCDVLAVLTNYPTDQLTPKDVQISLEAFMEEWKLFFRLRGRTERVKMIQAVVEALKDALQEVEKEMESWRNSGLKSGNSQESPESTPCPSPSES